MEPKLISDAFGCDHIDAVGMIECAKRQHGLLSEDEWNMAEKEALAEQSYLYLTAIGLTMRENLAVLAAVGLVANEMASRNIRGCRSFQWSAAWARKTLGDIMFKALDVEKSAVC